MIPRTSVRLAAAVGGAALAVGLAAPALATQRPEEVPLYEPHGDHTAREGIIGEHWEKECEPDKFDMDKFEEFPDDDIPDGHAAWRFVVSGERPQLSLAELELTFDGGEVTIDRDGASGDLVGRIGTPRDHVYLFTPEDWRLLDGTGVPLGGRVDERTVRVGYTCPGGDESPGPSPTATPTGTPTATPTATPTDTPTPTATPSTTPAPGNGGGGGEDEPGLPATGAQVGGMVLLGGGLVSAGIAMVAVRRRRNLRELFED